MVATPLGSERDRAVLRSFARRIDPSDAGAHNNLGVLYFNKGLYEEAVQAFMRALELDPRMQVAQRNLEIAYFNTGYYDERVPELKDRLRANAADREARWELARTYALLGEHDKAVEEFQALLRYSPNDVGAILQLGLSERTLEHPDHAQHWLERARERRQPARLRDHAGLHAVDARVGVAERHARRQRRVQRHERPRAQRRCADVRPLLDHASVADDRARDVAVRADRHVVADDARLDGGRRMHDRIAAHVHEPSTRRPHHRRA